VVVVLDDVEVPQGSLEFVAQYGNALEALLFCGAQVALVHEIPFCLPTIRCKSTLGELSVRSICLDAMVTRVQAPNSVAWNSDYDSLLQIFKRAAALAWRSTECGAKLPGNLWEEDSRLRGYSWYDKLPPRHGLRSASR